MGWLMANFFVDSVNGNDTDDGTTMDAGGGGGTGAWATLTKGLTSMVAAGDILWVRRTFTEAPAAHMQITGTGTASAPYRVIGWPRASDSTADGATWTSGSTTVDLVTTLSMDTQKHCARYVTAPDGDTYMITKVVDANTFLLNREYAGGTVTTTDGAFVIQEDEDYDLAQAIPAAEATERAAWDADPDDLPTWDGTGLAFYIYHNSDAFWTYDNIHFLTGTAQAMRVRFGRDIWFRGCIFEATANIVPVTIEASWVLFHRCIIFGTGAGNVQNGLAISYGYTILRDVSIYGTGDHGLSVYESTVEFDGCNIGVETVTAVDADIQISQGANFYGRDLWLGANVGELERGTASQHHTGTFIKSENHNRVLGAHKTFNAQGEILKTAVVAGSGDPYKRTGGSDSVLEIIYDLSTDAQNVVSPIENLATPILVHEFEATTDRRKYRYYVQAEGAVAASELWMEVEYVSSYGDATTEYTITKVTSDEAIAARDDASDWSQYIEVDNVIPALASKVRIKIYCSYYHATNKIYIDPLPEVTV
jgi:hypothetical protein